MKLPLYLREWLWVWYPVFVISLILFSLNYIFVSSSTWQELKNKRDQVESQQAVAGRLQTKLTDLRAIDQRQVEANLKVLNSAVPVNKQILPLIAQLPEPIAYQSAVGDISTASASQALTITADFAVADLGMMQRLLQDLESKAPLMEVRQVHWTADGKAKLIIEGVWSPLSKLTSDALGDLPVEDPHFEALSPKITTLNFPDGEKTTIPETGTNPVPF